ncbi:hypothetical protein AURDEDRAFT_171477 [Auricularia subglabra TFB-10046 SS5]|nr:hypothetical protein AURDEDRAFT_171477 [Auricularia subglabra TFB-10046 SS5]
MSFMACQAGLSSAIDAICSSVVPVLAPWPNFRKVPDLGGNSPSSPSTYSPSSTLLNEQRKTNLAPGRNPGTLPILFAHVLTIAYRLENISKAGRRSIRQHSGAHWASHAAPRQLYRDQEDAEATQWVLTSDSAQRSRSLQSRTNPAIHRHAGDLLAPSINGRRKLEHKIAQAMEAGDTDAPFEHCINLH